MQCGAAAGRAGDPHVPTEGFHSVDQADEPRPVGAVGSADAVIADGEHQIRPGDQGVDIQPRGVRSRDYRIDPAQTTETLAPLNPEKHPGR